MKFLKKIFNGFQVFLIAIYTVISATLGVVFLLFGKEKAVKWASFIWSNLIFKTLGIKLVIRDPHPKSFYWETTRIYVSNHESNLDIPALFLSTPRALFFLAKRELKNVPFMGWYMQLVGMVFINRGDRNQAQQSLKRAGDEIKKGKNILSFPEGTRTRTGEMGVFKRGTFRLALQNKIPIIPIAIKGARECIPAKRFEINPGTIYVNIGEPVYPNDWEVSEVDKFAFHVREEVKKLRAEL
ncbi:MAG: lysophospholipid acyltransferase family protein [Salibacter sp.]|uniref:lysophospholipid acyltransferase family protein n=1 Tax=Salibacter sp. TaxID=2010995 RepID=UPI00286FD0A0|nr:lysophospholipid acyltransferase family protein [Salibacter sp.]MDR9399437.1 lysophospholipid acyltransferase family protein [Salibacter sp.]